jgi:hypothetical protein
MMDHWAKAVAAAREVIDSVCWGGDVGSEYPEVAEQMISPEPPVADILRAALPHLVEELQVRTRIRVDSRIDGGAFIMLDELRATAQRLAKP